MKNGLKLDSIIPQTITKEIRMSNIDLTLDERLKTYGKFENHAEISQNLKRAMYQESGWQNLDEDMHEALEMIQHKIARIINGDPTYLDNWHDIIGYARLVEKRLEDKRLSEHNEKCIQMDLFKNNLIVNKGLTTEVRLETK